MSVESKLKTINMEKLFKMSTTVTFILQLVGGIVAIGGLVGWLISASGIVSTLPTDLIILLVLFGAGLAFLIFMIFIGVFIRFHDDIQKIVVGEKLGVLKVNSKESRLITTFLGFAIFFFFVSGVYSYFLLWKYYFVFLIGPSLSLYVLFLSIGLVYIATLAQVALMIVGRYANNLVAKISTA